MSLVKWIRKNNRKIMVFVVIFCMVSFVIGSYGLKIIASMIDPNKKAFATYDGGKMNPYDVREAQNELEVLSMLGVDRTLASQGLGGMLLSHLIFPGSSFVGDLPAQLKQAIQRGQLDLNIDELETYFSKQTERPAELWTLLKAEADRAGFKVSAATAEQSFIRMYAYSIAGQNKEIDLAAASQQAVAYASRDISRITSQKSMTKEQVFSVYADLLGVFNYANQVMSNQAVTLNQVKASLGRSKERLDAEYVKIDVEALIDKDATFSDADITAQFEAYKQNDAGIVTEDNPFGFGYKLPKRIQLEYMIVQTNDVKEKIDAPTNTEMDQYYRNNISQFQTSKPSDPNDPASEPIVTTQSFTEVERQIRSSIERQKTASLTSMIFNEMKDITEEDFATVTFEEATNSQLQMAAGDYEAAAKKIAEEHGITVTTGKTGWLSAADFQNEKILRSLSRQQNQMRLPLSEMAFVASTDPKQKRRIGLPAIRVWENIGPVTGGYYDAEASEYHPMTALVRVVGIEEAAVPADVNLQYNTQGVALFETEEDKAKATFSVKDQVVEDLRLKKAMDIADARGQELAKLVANSDWTEAVKAYNNKYAPGSNDPNNTESEGLAIRIEFANDQTRAAATEIDRIKQYMIQNPGMAPRIQQMLTMNELNNQLYALLDDAAESTGTISKVMPLEAARACYVVKEVIRQPATETDYLDGKSQEAMQLGVKDNAKLAMAHFSSENIVKRMKFVYKKKVNEEAPAEGDTATEETEPAATE